MDQLLSDKLQGRTLNDQVMDAALKALRNEGLYDRMSVAVTWGHPDDWQAEQIVLTRATFTEEGLTRKAIGKLTWSTDAMDRARGLVVWLVAETPEDVAWFRDNVDSITSQAFPTQKVPLVLMSPEAAEPEFARQLLRLWGLDQFNNTDRAEVGDLQFQAVRELAVESIKTSARHLKDNAKAVVPVPFQAHVHAIRSGDPEAVMSEVLKMAYSDGPLRWFTQYKQNATRLRSSTAKVIAYLLRKTLNTPGIFTADPVAKDITQLINRSGPW